MQRRFRKSLMAVLYSLAVILLTVFSVTSNAQTYRGGINGTVTDVTGAAIANAAVSAVETSTNLSYKALSTSAGEFNFTNLPPGSYTVTVAFSGFSTAKYDNVIVAAGSSYVLSTKLALSSTDQIVEVTAAALTLDTASDVQATVLPETVVQNLPNSGRDFTQMVAQTTGFAGLSSGGGGGDSSVNGTRSNSINWQIEGTDNNDFWWNIPAVNQGGVSAIAGVVFPIDAIESFNFVTTGSAALGRNPGGTANLVIKTGTNQLHGSAYYYNHNEFFERQNPFRDSKPASRLQDYGFSVGAPLKHDKFFFFLAGEHQNFLIGALSQATEPTAAYQSDAYSVLDFYGVPHSTVASNLLNGNGTLAGLWPAEALTGGDAPNNYQASGNLTGHSFNGLIKLDYKLSDKDHISARWFVAQGTQTAPTSSALTPYFENAPIHVQNYSIIYNRILTSSMANQLAAGVGYFNQVFGDADNSFDPIGLGLNTGVTDPALPGAPHLVIGPTGSGAGLTAGNTGFDPTGVTAPSGRNDITGHLDDDLTWTKGAHQMHFGGEFRMAQVDDFYQTGERGTLYFDGSQGPWNTQNFSAGAAQTPCAALATKNQGVAAPASATSNDLFLADFLAGCINPTASSIVLGDAKRQVFQTSFSLYAQDAWQITRNLNFNYGVRYDYAGPVHSDYPNLSIFDPTSPTGLAVAGQGVSNIYPNFWGAVSPRIGFAYQLDNTGNTVLRGGYGYYYDTVYVKGILQNNGVQNISVFGPGLNPAGSNLVVNAQGLNQTIQPGVDIYPTLAAASQNPSPGSQSISTYDPHYRPSDTQIWDLNIQHSISNSVILQIGYVGSKGTHLTGMFDINAAALGSAYIPCPAGESSPSGGCSINQQQLTRPYNAQFPNFGVIDETRSNLGSIYHSLQTTLRIQSWHGLTSQLNYTWSHALDYETGLLPYLPQDPTNEKAEYGNSDYDVRNTFTGYFNYDIPAFRGPQRLTHGWQVTSGFSLHGGTPYTVTASSNVSGNGDNADRAVQVIANPNNVSHAIVDGSVQWFNPNAFVDPAPGTYSLTRRGQNYNPGYEAFDLSATKTTAITERVKIQFKANMYNLFNHTNLASVGFPSTGEGGTIGETIGPYLGNPTIGPGEPFNTEFALKILF
ncbi:TonB-dependent receptor [Granulicella sp. L60]|uniref:TonB-dependent receptor n=1 Tax=Granulicella sp. L60 TaxID=1641866 RepID=UPI00131E6CD5|nr:TonB-dependent receptor [Granulicella sp. L60]